MHYKKFLSYLYLSLHILDGVRRLHVQDENSVEINSSLGLHKDLHSSALGDKPQDQVQGALLLDVVVGQGAAVLQLLPSKDETLLVGRNTLPVLESYGVIAMRKQNYTWIFAFTFSMVADGSTSMLQVVNSSWLVLVLTKICIPPRSIRGTR